MDNKDTSILAQVAFKKAVDTVLAGHTETPDVAGEVSAWTETYYDNLLALIERKQQEAGNTPNSRSQTSGSSRSYSGGSNRQASNRGGNGNFQIKDPNSPATEAQIRKLQALNVQFDNNITKGQASDLISANN